MVDQPLQTRGRGLRPRDAWKAALEDGWLAYRVWCRAHPSEKHDAYIAYVAAVDREDAAALSYARARAGATGHQSASPNDGVVGGTSV